MLQPLQCRATDPPLARLTVSKHQHSRPLCRTGGSKGSLLQVQRRINVPDWRLGRRPPFAVAAATKPPLSQPPIRHRPIADSTQGTPGHRPPPPPKATDDDGCDNQCARMRSCWEPPNGTNGLIGRAPQHGKSQQQLTVRSPPSVRRRRRHLSTTTKKTTTTMIEEQNTAPGSAAVATPLSAAVSRITAAGYSEGRHRRQPSQPSSTSWRSQPANGHPNGARYRMAQKIEANNTHRTRNHFIPVLICVLCLYQHWLHETIVCI